MNKLQDTRQIKKPIPAGFYFNVERRATGDYKGMEFAEVARLITKEFKELPQGEKKVRSFIIRELTFSLSVLRQKFDDLAAQDRERYDREKKAQAA